MRSKNIFIVGGVIVILLFLFLSNSEKTDSQNEVTPSQEAGDVQNTEEHFSSAIEPLKIVEVNDRLDDVELSNDARKAVQLQFSQATEYVLKLQWDKAETNYLDLIEKFPSVVESYINLAAVYAATNRMNEARKILMQGVQANQNYAVLFESLRSIHGELAAEAYRAALVADEQSHSAKLDLPIISSIDLSPIDLSRRKELAQQVSALQAEQESEQNSQARIAQLEQDLIAAKNQGGARDDSSSSLVSQLEEKLVELNLQLTTQTKALALAEQELGDLRQATSTVAMAAAQVVPVTAVAEIDKAEVKSIPVEIELTESLDEKAKIKLAASLVESWADSWSQQDVAGYISHYSGDYSPPRAEMTHQEWADQREVRLTNKKFIQVDVSDFDFEERDGEQFGVTFTQRYRSNTIDDTIRKKLIFATKDGSVSADSLGKAKIVDEIIVTN